MLLELKAQVDKKIMILDVKTNLFVIFVMKDFVITKQFGKGSEVRMPAITQQLENMNLIHQYFL